MATILLYHLYPINNWKEVTSELFSYLPYENIIVHVSLPDMAEERQAEVASFLRQYPVDKVLYSPNSGKGEYDALLRFVKECTFDGYDSLTYLHSKGVTKPDNPHIQNWRRLMYYFVVQRRELIERAIRRGFVTYGINKTPVSREADGFRGSQFFYEGNFVSLNLRKVNLREAVEQLLENDYYGVEGFWGKLCPDRLGFSPFNSGINHYRSSVSPDVYKSALARWHYRVIKNFYQAKAYILSKLRHASYPDKG